MALLLTLAGPLIVLSAAVIGLSFGMRPLTGALIACFGLLAGAVSLYIGVDHSCTIAENECLGASGTALVVGLVWLMATILFAIKLHKSARVS
ncbi:hypothetical protein [Ensifer sp. BR816]|uniref:hypothetical protein n=1 Tax=Rhizobium sp. (strain BR816) TaxID=1057002 RepID=UPI00037FAE98|nr:hypothetical protein [Ensifer sp. BR816]